MKRFTALLLAAVMLLALAACGGSSDSPSTAPDPAPTNAPAEQTDSGADSSPEAPAAEDGAPQYGGSLTLQFGDFNTVFDPAMGEQYVYSLWLEYLFAPSWELNDPSAYSFAENTFTLETAQGQIADSWDWNPESMEFTVTIRDDIYFQEKDAEYDIFGARKLTAEDVKYSYDRVAGTGSGFDESNYVVIDGDWRMRLNMLESIEVTDEFTVVFKMNTASETKLSEFIISQINITGAEWDTLDDSQKNDWKYACGTGPYILTEFVPDNHYTYVKNENYYDYDERYPENKLPYLDSITLQKFGDSTSVISNFISGDLDYIYTMAGLSDSEKAQLVSNVSDCIVNTFPYSAPAIGLKVNEAPFDDINVRIAMQKAMNLEEVNSAYYGYEELMMPGLWSQSLAGFSAVGDWDDGLKDEYSYDPEGAKALLAEAGYEDGFEFTVSIDPMADVDLFQLAKGYLAAVGITMNIEVLSDMMEGREVQGNPDDRRMFNFDMGGATDAGFAYQTFATTGFAYNTYHGDTKMDELMAKTRDAMSLSEQVEAARETDLYFSQQHWLIAMSGLTYKEEFVSSGLGGLENGELMSASHFLKTMSARIWAK